jgi:hypothetical protein
MASTPMSSWICDGLQRRGAAEPAADADEPVAPDAPPVDDDAASGIRVRAFRAEALGLQSEPPPPTSRRELPASYRASRSSGARVMLGISANPYKRG